MRERFTFQQRSWLRLSGKAHTHHTDLQPFSTRIGKSTGISEGMDLYMCVCVCVCVRARARACMLVSVCSVRGSVCVVCKLIFSCRCVLCSVTIRTGLPSNDSGVQRLRGYRRRWRFSAVRLKRLARCLQLIHLVPLRRPPPPPPPPPSSSPRQLTSVHDPSLESLLHRAGTTLRASLSGTFLRTLPDLVTPLKEHSLSPRSCPATRSAPSERFGY